MKILKIFGVLLKRFLGNCKKPFPTKEDFQEFAIEQNLGTIFYVLNKKVYILDTKTFTILDTYPLSYDENETKMPFYTRVEEIESSILDFSFSDLLFFTDKKELSYDEYYEEILGLKKWFNKNI